MLYLLCITLLPLTLLPNVSWVCFANLANLANVGRVGKLSVRMRDKLANREVVLKCGLVFGFSTHRVSHSVKQRSDMIQMCWLCSTKTNVTLNCQIFNGLRDVIAPC